MPIIATWATRFTVGSLNSIHSSNVQRWTASVDLEVTHTVKVTTTKMGRVMVDMPLEATGVAGVNSKMAILVIIIREPPNSLTIGVDGVEGLSPKANSSNNSNSSSTNRWAMDPEEVTVL